MFLRSWCILILATLATLALQAGVAVAQIPLPAPKAPSASTTPNTTSIPAYRKASNVAIITIQGEIDGGGRFGRSILAFSVDRRIKAAVRGGADAIVFEVDSPGGEVGAALRISSLIKECPIPNTVAWVRPQALSGGAVIALAARELIVSDPATLGDAMPIQFGPDGAKALSPDLLKKVLPPLIADLLDSARRHNDAVGEYTRDEYLMRAISATDMELWWVRNKDTGVEMAIDRSEFELLFPGGSTAGTPRLASAPGSTPRDTSTPAGPDAPGGSAQLAAVNAEVNSRLSKPTTRPKITPADAGNWVLVDKILDGSAPAVFGALDLAHYNIAANRLKAPDGQVVLQPIKTDADIKAFFGASNVTRLNASWSEGLVFFLTNMWVRGVLIAIFLLALFVEMSHPGAILPGAISLLALVLLIGPPLLIGMANWWEVVAILAGIALLAVEAFILPGFGVAGILGLILLFGGLLGTFVPSGSGLFPTSGHGSNELMWGALTIMASVLTAGVGMYFIARHFGSIPFLNKLVLRDAEPAEVGGTMLLTQLDDAPAVVGDIGITLTRMAPAGRIDLQGRVVDAVSDFGFLQPGVKVRVVSVDGIRVGVERVADRVTS
jgi:membrane-bound serine protease (ClpP class)